MKDKQKAVFAAIIQTSADLFLKRCGIKVVAGVDYVLDYDLVAIHSVTDDGVRFIQFCADKSKPIEIRTDGNNLIK
jgi:hypothetical protein